MSGFDLHWLDLREAADHAARAPGLLAAAAASLGSRGLIVDLGCGTGSTVRAMRERLKPGVRWRLVDNDRRLLAAAAARHPEIEAAATDLAAVESIPLDGARLVSASALLDLVSPAWLITLAERLEGCGFYAALSYDGVMRWDAAHPMDTDALAAFNRHQGGDKGFGPALGPRATNAAAKLFASRGWRVLTAPSPWKLGKGDIELECELIQGVAQAALEAGFEGATTWGEARTALAGKGCSVGHQDLLALPG